MEYQRFTNALQTYQNALKEEERMLRSQDRPRSIQSGSRLQFLREQLNERWEEYSSRYVVSQLEINIETTAQRIQDELDSARAEIQRHEQAKADELKVLVTKTAAQAEELDDIRMKLQSMQPGPERSSFGDDADRLGKELARLRSALVGAARDEDVFLDNSEPATPRTSATRSQLQPPRLPTLSPSGFRSLRGPRPSFPSSPTRQSLRVTQSSTQLTVPGFAAPSRSPQQAGRQRASEPANAFAAKRGFAGTPDDEETGQRSPIRQRGEDGNAARNALPKDIREESWVASQAREWSKHSQTIFEFDSTKWPTYPVTRNNGRGGRDHVDSTQAATRTNFDRELRSWASRNPNTNPWKVMNECAEQMQCLTSIIKGSGKGGRPAPDHRVGFERQTRSCDTCKNNRLCLRLTKTDDDVYARSGTRYKVWPRELEGLETALERYPEARKERSSSRRTSAATTSNVA